jgi:preprotein translocase subunit SecA
MSAQRKTIYDMRQAMLVGRYEPDVLDEEGKATGQKRKIKPLADIDELVAPDVGYLLGMFLDDPIMARDSDGKPRPITRKDFEKASPGGRANAPSTTAKFVELETLQREMYQKWGVKVDVEDREEDVLAIYDEVRELVPQALTEQRERLLDLIDRILGAMVEESCPPRKPPEDWEWGGIFQGMREHFLVDLPDSIADIHDPEVLAQDLFRRAEEAFEKLEEKVGEELILRIFRHIYLEEVDKAWVDHLTEMDHLRDSIGLRGYGQKDPKQEYKKEGYNLFINMVARVSSNVVTKLFAVNVKQPEEEDQRELEELARQQALAQQARPRHEPVGEDDVEQEVLVPPPAHALNDEMECPCGSGKPFRQCHGTEEEATV